MHSIVPEEQLKDKLIEYGDYIKWGIIALVLVCIAYFAIKKLIARKRVESAED